MLAFSSDGRANGVKKVSETEAELGDPALDELLTPYLHQQLVDEIEMCIRDRSRAAVSMPGSRAMWRASPAVSGTSAAVSYTHLLHRCGAQFTREGDTVTFAKAPLHGVDICLLYTSPLPSWPAVPSCWVR